MNNLERAIIFASEAHFGQVDKQGRPYISHCLRVMSALEATEDKIVGVLHDTIEDTDATWGEISGLFGEEIANDVQGLTRRKDERYDRYIKLLKDWPRRVRVKRADLLDNLREDRLRMLPPPLADHFRVRYTQALESLDEVLARNEETETKGEMTENCYRPVPASGPFKYGVTGPERWPTNYEVGFDTGIVWCVQCGDHVQRAFGMSIEEDLKRINHKKDCPNAYEEAET